MMDGATLCKRNRFPHPRVDRPLVQQVRVPVSRNGCSAGTAAATIPSSWTRSSSGSGAGPRYLWRAVDRYGEIVDVLIHERRDAVEFGASSILADLTHGPGWNSRAKQPIIWDFWFETGSVGKVASVAYRESPCGSSAWGPRVSVSVVLKIRVSMVQLTRIGLSRFSPFGQTHFARLS
jgi:hypothetical protein